VKIGPFGEIVYKIREKWTSCGKWKVAAEEELFDYTKKL